MSPKAQDIRCDVLHLNTERFMRGGEVQTLGLMRRLVAGGLRCTLLAKDDGVLLQRAGAEGLSTVGLPLRGEFDLLSARKIRRVVRESGATILHCHTAHALGLGLWATLGMTCRPALVASRRVSFPLKHSASRWKYRRADAIVAVSEEVRASLLGRGLAPDKVWTIHSGVDLARFEALPTREDSRRRFGLPHDAPIVGAVGALVDHKGHGDLLLALAGLRRRGLPVRAAFAGEGQLREALARRAENLGVPVIFLGYVTEPAALYPGLDVLALPSLSGEGSPGVIKEAAAAGTPVVATAVSGTGEILRDGVEALLVPPGEPRRLEEALFRILGDPALARTLTEAARARIRAFSMDRMARSHVELYGHLTSAPAPFTSWREPTGSRGTAS